jgi:hypothetical protein
MLFQKRPDGVLPWPQWKRAQRRRQLSSYGGILVIDPRHDSVVNRMPGYSEPAFGNAQSGHAQIARTTREQLRHHCRLDRIEPVQSPKRMETRPGIGRAFD